GTHVSENALVPLQVRACQRCGAMSGNNASWGRLQRNQWNDSEAEAGGTGNEYGELSILEIARFGRLRNVSFTAFDRRRVQGVNLHRCPFGSSKIQTEGKIVLHIFVQ